MTSDFFQPPCQKNSEVLWAIQEAAYKPHKHRKNDGGSLVEPILHRRGSQEIGKAPRCHGNG